MRAKPLGRLLALEQLELDDRAAAAGPRHRGVERAHRLVGRDHDGHVESLADHAVDQVQQARQPLAGAVLRVRGEQLVAVLQHEKTTLAK